MNKYEEAYERLRSKEYHYPDYESVYVDIETLGELVAKATPKKPTVDHYFEKSKIAYYSKYHPKPNYLVCPTCGSDMIYDDEYFLKMKYCPDCGQALDWGDDDE